MYHLTKGSKKLRQLREEPQSDIELPDGGPLRNLIERLKLQSGRGASERHGKGSIETVYYLVGDERRAVRKFIQLNTEYVKDCFGKENKNNPLRQKLPEEMYWLMEQEYEIMEYTGEI
jgi:hypothetical protein